MKEQVVIIETLFEKTESYTRNGVELIKLKSIDKFADITSTLIARLTVITFITLFFLILNIGVALWLGEIFGKNYYGFFAVSGFYAIIGIILFVFRTKWIKSPLQNSIITQALN